MPSNIAGNWLLAGSLPQGDPFGKLHGTQLSVTVATVGSRFVGVGQAFLTCSPATGSPFEQTSIDLGFTLEGEIEADGTFSVQSPSTTLNGAGLPTVSLTGQVPAKPGGAWLGEYAIDTTAAKNSCSKKVSGQIEASAFAPVTGTYRSVGSLEDGTTQTPVTVTMTLQQGVTSTNAGVESHLAYVLNGRIGVEGASCFHTGTLRSQTIKADGEPVAVGSLVFGAAAFPGFSMDDGSQLDVHAYIADVEAMQLTGHWSGCEQWLMRQHIYPPAPAGGLHATAVALSGPPEAI